MEHKIAVIGGDGIGPEVTAEAVKTLKATKAKFTFTELDWGVAYLEKGHKDVVPDDYLDQLQRFDAILFGAWGMPAKYPDRMTIRPLLEIRQAFDQYAGVRPAVLYPGVPCPLAGRKAFDIDMIVIRENSEGEYLNIGGRKGHGKDTEMALQTAVFTRKGCERIFHYAFKVAQTRPRKKVTCVTKSNALTHSMVFWDEVFDQVKAGYPGITTDKMHVDAAGMDFVRNPSRFDVVVASNMFGDILTDLGGIVAGGLGVAPSGNVDPDRKKPSLFEPVHGSAPDIAGKGLANPVAAILSAAMLAEHLGETAGAAKIRAAVGKVLEKGKVLTPDFKGKSTTSQVGDAIAMEMEI